MTDQHQDPQPDNQPNPDSAVSDFYRVEVAKRGNKPAHTIYIQAVSQEWALHDTREIWTGCRDYDRDRAFWEVESEDEPPTAQEMTVTLLTSAEDILEAYDTIRDCGDDVELSDVFFLLGRHCTESDQEWAVQSILADEELWWDLAERAEESPLYALADVLDCAPIEFFQRGVITQKTCARWEPQIKCGWSPKDSAMTGGLQVWSWDINGGLPGCTQDPRDMGEVHVLWGNPEDGFVVIPVLPPTDELSQEPTDYSYRSQRGGYDTSKHSVLRVHGPN